MTEREELSAPPSPSEFRPRRSSACAQVKLSYSAASDRYLDVVGTDPSWRGTCRKVDVELADGTHHEVHVHFTK